MRQLLRDRDFRFLLAGQTLSAFGDYAMFLAIGIWAKELTGSNAAAGLTILPFALPALAGPALGVIVDRFPRRHVMIVTDLLAAVVVLGLLAVDGPEDLWILYFGLLRHRGDRRRLPIRARRPAPRLARRGDAGRGERPPAVDEPGHAAARAAHGRGVVRGVRRVGGRDPRRHDVPAERRAPGGDPRPRPRAAARPRALVAGDPRGAAPHRRQRRPATAHDRHRVRSPSSSGAPR